MSAYVQPELFHRDDQQRAAGRTRSLPRSHRRPAHPGMLPDNARGLQSDCESMKQRILLGMLASLVIYGCHPPRTAVLASNQPAGAANVSCDSTFFDTKGLAVKCAQLQLIGTGYQFTEGPAVDDSGNVFFTDQPNNKIHHWDWKTGQITTFLDNSGRANGMTFDADGFL